MNSTKKRLPGRRSIGYTAFFVIALLAVLLPVMRLDSPDRKIVGKWREVSWKYELVNSRQDADTVSGKEIARDAREQIARELIIHEAETWEFKPNGKLLLHRKNGKTTVLNWTLKGRGHVLQLDHKNRSREFYDLSDLDKEQMILYVDVEIQAKGIVRMTFKKIT